jgi:hypothetical protein
MLLFRGVFGLLFVFVWIFCIIDVITTPKEQIRNLPKLVWVFIVILLPDVGSIVWLIAGRNWNKAAARTAGTAQPRTSPGTWPRATPRASRRASNPDDDEEFLASLRARAEEQRRRAREAQQPDKPDDGT